MFTRGLVADPMRRDEPGNLAQADAGPAASCALRGASGRKEADFGGLRWTRNARGAAR